MKTIQYDHSFEARIVSLYKDDLDDMIEVLRASASNVVISDGESEYASLEELEKQKGSTLNAITIQTSQPYISLRLKKKARLFCASDPDAETPFLRLKEMMQSRKSVASLIWDPWACWVSAIALMILGVITKNPISSLYFIGAILVWSSGLLWYITSCNVFFSINLAKCHAVTTWWSRDRDKIIFGLIFAVGTAIGGVTVKIIDKFF
jgi:hypothetical protein